VLLLPSPRTAFPPISFLCPATPGSAVSWLPFAFPAPPLTSPSNQDRSADYPVAKKGGEKQAADNREKKAGEFVGASQENTKPARLPTIQMN
jgi:hypothetical protein